MICKHCGKELPDGAKYCPYCAEPVDRILTDEETADDNAQDMDNAMTIKFLKGDLIALILSAPLGMIIALGVNNSIHGFWGYFFGSYLLSTIIVIIYCMIERNNKRRSNIALQYYRDKTSICPRCGSHNIRVYRKGYDFNEAFWGEMFEVKGTRYTAGMDANNAMCKCNHCGYRWNSGYDIREI